MRTLEETQQLIDITNRLLATLTPREEKVLRMRFGYGERKPYTVEEIAQDFSTTTKEISKIESSALRKLRSPSRTKILHSLSSKYQQEISPPIAIRPLIESAGKLTLELISYLKANKEEIDKIRWDVFEHLVAEFLASKGFVDVRLVGRDHNTSADIYAVHLIESINKKIRFFVEVKREKKQVGISIINSLCGAISLEREKYGWHAGIIVSVNKFADTKKFTRAELELRGVDLKDRNDLFAWLDEYQPNKDGLWLPNPEKKMPSPHTLMLA